MVARVALSSSTKDTVISQSTVMFQGQSTPSDCVNIRESGEHGLVGDIEKGEKSIVTVRVTHSV